MNELAAVCKTPAQEPERLGVAGFAFSRGSNSY